MSLFLRKACQDNLDGVGLENYHIQVDENTKCLQIVGECGDVLVSITGIRLSRMAPADKEIELALELFDDFLAKHAGTFKEFIAAKIRADKASIPKIVPGLMNCTVDKGMYQEFHQLTFDMSADPNREVTVRSNGYFSMPSLQIDMVKFPDADIQLSITATERKAVRNWVNACTEFNKAINIKTELLTKLSACEI